VDRVLHGREGVSTETRARIEAIVGSLGYRPNILARQLALGKTWLFRVLVPRADQDSGYWAHCLEGIRAATRQLEAFAVRVDVVEFDRYDPAAYRKTLARVVAGHFDGLLVAPVLPAVIGPALARLPPGFPYAFFDAHIEGSSAVFSIGQDAYAAGGLAARLLGLLAPGGGHLVALDAHPEDSHIRRRVEGFAAWLAEGRTRRALVRDCPGFEHAATCASWMERLFEEAPETRGILVASASGHLAGEWLAARGMKERCAVLSWDLVPANARALRLGVLDCVISQRPFEQGRIGLDRLYRAVVHGDPGGSLTIASEIIFKENLPPEAASREAP
jgi:LacI family transcriptional regulator